MIKPLRSAVFFADTLLIYLGVPLLGWGLGDLEGFFSYAPCLGYAAAVGIFSLALALSGLGYGLIFVSGLALGRQYSADVIIQEHHRLVTTGIYRYTRHPRYLGILALAVGMPILFRSWIDLLVCLVSIGVLLFRVRDEEMLLQEVFGSQWEAY